MGRTGVLQPPHRGTRFREGTEIIEDGLARAVLEGLSGRPKSLASKYLYDSRGDQIFQQITELPEYYLTRCEEEILRANKGDLLQRLFKVGQSFSLVELGPGDGKKTKILLSHFLRSKARFSYLPVDISKHALDGLCAGLARQFPSLRVLPFAKDYFLALDDIAAAGTELKLILFMGGNIGNFSKEQAARFLLMLSARLHPGDLLLAGFDLKKDPAVIYHAYNDRQGVTRSFNFNLLRRINRELEADFNPANFMHYPTYDPVTGAMKSFLIAETAHQVNIKKLGVQVSFHDWEPIFMEESNKYDVPEITQMALNAGMREEALYYDHKKYYANALFSKV